ncbi:MAG: M28 family peptidase, partial [Planctomycetota bacterium]
MRCKAMLLLALGAALASAQEAQPAPGVNAAELIGHVRRLASDEWAGRGTGTEGERKATEYIAAHFARLGLAPAGEKGGFFQEVSVPDRVDVDPACRLELRGADATLALDKDWRPFSLSASGQVEGDVVFAGYGIRAKDLAYDDYAGLDVRGKIVVVFRHLPHGTPAWRAPGARRKHAPFLAKLGHAIQGGAIGLIVVNDPFNFPAAGGGGRRRSRPDRLQRGNVGAGPRRIAFAHLTLAAARRVFPALLGATPEALEAAIHAGPAPAPASRPGSARLRLDLKVEPKFVTGRNVCALLAAGAPDSRDEVVVVGAHHDHLGRGGAFGSLARSREERRGIHNGADDNASGTAGVLEVAAYLAARRDRLRRSVLFLTFTGEERGLLGSRYFVEHPTVPLDRMVAMLNLDMIGRLDGRAAFVGGVKTSPAFRSILERRAAELDQ